MQPAALHSGVSAGAEEYTPLLATLLPQAGFAHVIEFS
jgi:hypothetical protein